MARRDLTQPDIDPNGLVAWNLRQARTLRGWTQAETVERLSEFGIQWSVPSLSDAERSWKPDARYREFTAADLVTLSLTFDLPLSWWFLPPTSDATGDVTIGVPGGTIMDRIEILDLVFGSSPVVDERLTALDTSPAIVPTERLRITAHLAHLEQQEHDLRSLLNDVIATQELLEAQAQALAQHWTDEGDDDG